ncbi:MAG: TIGR03617 family F420-dependent LLM class oxidoreductase [Gammaproteobacteria bacterium]|nr:TIGR03617 family F420-dependent LLM class oxidoreductase [Gammaproteobacteria bacterium]
MRILNTIAQHDLNASRADAVAAETAGYDGITTLENRHDPFLPLAVAATATRRIELVTGVAIAFLRSPMSLANIGWDLQRSSGGRFTLGLGPQIRAHNEKRFSVPWSAPVPRLREYVQSLRAIWQAWQGGGELRYEGEHYRFTLMPPNFRPEPMDLPPPRILLAAVGPAMLKLAGEVADGVILHPFCTRPYIEQTVLPALAAGFARSGRNREDFEIVGGGFVATGADDDEVRRHAEWVRQRIGFYGSTPAYWPVLESCGMRDLGERLNVMTKEGRWDALAAEVPDDLLQACAAVAQHDELASAVAARFGGLSDSLPLSASSEQPAEVPERVIAALRRIPSGAG